MSFFNARLLVVTLVRDANTFSNFTMASSIIVLHLSSLNRYSCVCLEFIVLGWLHMLIVVTADRDVLILHSEADDLISNKTCSDMIMFL